MEWLLTLNSPEFSNWNSSVKSFMSRKPVKNLVKQKMFCVQNSFRHLKQVLFEASVNMIEAVDSQLELDYLESQHQWRRDGGPDQDTVTMGPGTVVRRQPEVGVSETIISLSKSALIPGGSDSLVYTTLSGSVGMLRPSQLQIIVLSDQECHWRRSLWTV